MTTFRPAVVLDAGALIALERSKPQMTSLLRRVLDGRLRVVVPDAVLAQVWRGGSGRQARIATLVGLDPDRCTAVPLDGAAARRIGVLAGSSGHRDVVDVHVVLLARDLAASVLTSDRGDLLAVDPALGEQIVDV